ncbi:preprotein translocase subunit SecE [Limnochorda pilosa]|uniref:Protein translocase subunit SecE n=1 Tax=Limnochorda pilosa TaxID=1555112 RepID=A0A0K2SPP2_LIMPI|nr:preprotein translocase subunit SecE [Limnochorda pilosa]
MATRQGLGRRAAQFLREVRSEARKIAWPNRRELTVYTAVVLVVVAATTLFVAVADLGISQLIHLVGIL